MAYKIDKIRQSWAQVPRGQNVAAGSLRTQQSQQLLLQKCLKKFKEHLFSQMSVQFANLF